MATYLPTTAVANAELDTMFQSMFVSLHTGDPGLTGASEVAGGSYIRQAENFGAAAAKALTNAAAIEFAGMPAVTVTHVGFWSADTAGVFKGGAALVAGVPVLVTQTARFAAGALDVAWL